MPLGSKGKHLISAAASIPARAETVYAIIANYHSGHPRILPDQFSGMTVEKGGIGAGTVIRFQMRLWGIKRRFRAAVTEPEPGRVLVETDLDANGAVTTFTVDRGPAAGESLVTIATELPVRPGVAGSVERFLSTRLLHPIYVRELTLLAEFAATAPKEG